MPVFKLRSRGRASIGCRRHALSAHLGEKLLTSIQIFAPYPHYWRVRLCWWRILRGIGGSQLCPRSYYSRSVIGGYFLQLRASLAESVNPSRRSNFEHPYISRRAQRVITLLFISVWGLPILTLTSLYTFNVHTLYFLYVVAHVRFLFTRTLHFSLFSLGHFWF